MTIKSYQNTQRITEDPRQTEYRLFGQVTGALIEAQKTAASGGALMEVIDWNRKIWQTLAFDCADQNNTLPENIRANIVSLSFFVTKYSTTVMRERAPLDPLISINRTIMEGLRGAA